MILFYHKKGNGQNYRKSLFLNAVINVKISFLFFFLQIESSIFHSTGSGRAVVLTGAKGSNPITVSFTPEKILFLLRLFGTSGSYVKNFFKLWDISY